MPGAYTARESGVPAGYAPAAEQTTTLTGGETSTLTFENQRLFTIIVVVCQESTNQFYSSTVTIGNLTYVSLSQAAAKAAGLTDQQIAAFCSVGGGARSAGNTARAQPYPASVTIPVTPLPEVGKTP